jgi:branched-chain amino acid transport system ATP-binding protein
VSGAPAGLRLEALEVRLRRLRILRGVTLEAPAGMVVGLIGRNGAGKTTTLRSIMGLVPLAAGEIALDGVRLRDLPPHHRPRLGIGYMPEDRRLVPALTVEENLLVPIWANGFTDGAARLAAVYDRIPLVRTLARRRAAYLSGGQQKLVALARALMVGRRVLLLDEPFEGLAPALADEVGAILAGALPPDLVVLVAESESRRVARLARRLYTIERGAIVGAAGP